MQSFETSSKDSRPTHRMTNDGSDSKIIDSEEMERTSAPENSVFELIKHSGFTPPTDYFPDLIAAEFPGIQTRSYSIAKRLFDIAFASLSIMATLPLLLLIACAIKLSSPGPVFFRQERVGRNGRIFTILKFRTMLVADRSFTDTAWRAGDDPRRTKLGQLLRQTCLDELPQFFNVLLGEMSVVGPRPERPFFVEKFTAAIPRYDMRHVAEVGITGLAQIHGYRGDTCIETRLAYDLEYLRNWSFSRDLVIVWLTAKGVIASLCNK